MVALAVAGFAGPGSLSARQIEEQTASRADERDVAEEGGHDEHDEAESDDPAAHVHEEIVVTGSRARERSVTQSMVPIDVISAEHVAHQGETNLDALLRNVVPSLNISSVDGDAATVVRPTNRNIQRADAELLIAAGNTHVSDPAQEWGAPKVDDDVKLWVNFGRPTDAGAQFYGHANYAGRRVGARNFFFRNPNTRQAVFSNDGGATLLIGDSLDAADGVDDGSAGCPAVPVRNGLPEQGALARVFGDPNCFSFQERFPGGFQPVFGGDRRDASIVGGVRGALPSGTLWGVSLSAGLNEVDFFLYDSVNASLGPATPTSFKPGLYGQREVGVNFDLARRFDERLHVAAGLEWRSEGFEIGLGDRASWEIGPYASQGFSSGSNGFPGFSPIAAGDWERANAAVYGDLEYGPPDLSWSLGAALRFEDYEDFGSTLNGKVAGRVEAGPKLALRASVSTGFRAPTPGQQNAFNVSTQWLPELMELVNNGTIPPSSRVAALRGGKALEPEESLNLAAGVIVERGAFTLTADVFRVDLRDRLGVTQLFALEPNEVEQLLAEGITSAANLANFRFFANDFETRTDGVDLVASWRPERRGNRHTTFDLVVNLTTNEVTDFNPRTLDARRIRELRESLPELRWNATVHREIGRVELLGRLGYFGGWWDPRDGWSYGGAQLLDVEAAIRLDASTRLVVGGRNALDTSADRNPNPTVIGNVYSTRAPFDVNGGFYYARLQYRWDGGGQAGAAP